MALLVSEVVEQVYVAVMAVGVADVLEMDEKVVVVEASLQKYYCCDSRAMNLPVFPLIFEKKFQLVLLNCNY